MQIGIIGSGMIGGTLTHLLAGLGHDVVVSNSRGPESLAALVERAGDHARAATVAEAADAGDVVVVAIPLGRYRQLPVAPLAGKIVIDAMNYYAGRDGDFPELDAGTTGSSEMLAEFLGDARVVKAFNTIYFEHLRHQGTPAGTPGRRALPIAGDDADAKRVVAGLIDELGFDVHDTGALIEGRRQQPGTAVYNVALTRDELAAALA